MKFEEYFDQIHRMIRLTAISTKGIGDKGSFEESMRVIADFIIDSTAIESAKMMLIGNGGSAAIASHGAIDFFNSVGIKAVAFSDMATCTCISNDYGYENLFGMQIDMFAEKGDVVIAISSSGNSKNILNGLKAAQRKKCGIVTLSGFNPQNPLRQLGDYNLYIPSSEYGVVEVCHQILMHALTDYLRLKLKVNKPTKVQMVAI